MKNQLSLNIQTPCSENFNQFKATEKGGFCTSCEKEVIDFTTMNSEEIIFYFKNKSNNNTCGKFKNNQLKTYYNKPNQAKKLSFFGGIGLACLTLFSFGTLQAQDTKKETDNKTSKVTIKNNIFVKGTVSEHNLPMIGVNVVLEGTNIGTTTDFDGNFEFPELLKKGDVLVFSILGMDTQKVTITDESSASNIVLKVDMDMTEIVLMGKVAVKEVYSSKKTDNH
ncbi:carboxypeptidase-like regulatory domain-containing protein [Psychroserpens ponticola]|uniref:Carboxypeptidase-like regulatory domain-containing protein n=1 Tax=Psychroserpens ponticola TaxID=2932268 RepID=A0ABY7RVU5_9FLAO|nr:carboxypeptidase-like regulatory domain-containing protein [Psychroserpens ponticola]WCO00958.1 carboxypeptidase-like regulatory domain-containing protein [Psychroserpens ponticola]